MSSDVHSLPPPSAFTHRLHVSSADQTRALGRRLAGLLDGGEIVLLYGDLGVGKTCLTQGICQELGVTDEVVSPTFTLVNSYTGRLVVHHLDFFRVEAQQDLSDIGVPEILDEIWDGGAVGLIEWPGPLLPALAAGPRVELLATLGTDATDRCWHMRGFPQAPSAWQSIFQPKGNSAC